MPIAALHFFFSHAALAVSDTNERGAALKAPAAALEARRIKEMHLKIRPTLEHVDGISVVLWERNN